MSKVMELMNAGLISLPLVIHQAIEAAERKAKLAAQYVNLGGYNADPYDDLARQIDRSIGRLKRARKDAQALRAHTHDWDQNDYCVICGADGRA